MLIHLSNDMYVNSEKITYIYKRLTPESTWAVHLGVGDQVILSQAHFDELMACLPTPVEAEKPEPKYKYVENAMGGFTPLVKTKSGWIEASSEYAQSIASDSKWHLTAKGWMPDET